MFFPTNVNFSIPIFCFLKLFPAVTTQMVNDFLRGLEPAAGTDFGKLHLYRLRHRGASSAIAQGYLTTEEVLRMGRWRTLKSFQRYEKASRLAQLMYCLPAKTKTAALAAEELLKAALARF